MKFSRVLSAPFYFLSGLVPRNPRRVLFGAWDGNGYGDNPRFLAEFLAEAAPDLELVWSGRENVRESVSPGLQFVRHGSLISVWKALTAGTCFVSHGYPDVVALNVLRGCRLVDLGHGFAIKNMGVTTQEVGNAIVLFFKSLVRRVDSSSYYTASSEEHAGKLAHEYVRWFREGTILKTGQPRMDPLIRDAQDHARRASIRHEFSERYGIPESGPLVVYLPTFRDESQRLFSFSRLTADQRGRMDATMAELGAFLLEKGHPVEASGVDAESQHPPAWLVNLSSTPGIDTQSLLLITDVLITDYSGVYLDFLALDRPIIHFAYDMEEYSHRDRGMYYDLQDIAGGSIVNTFEELIAVLPRQIAEPGLDSPGRIALRERMLTWERGQSSRRVAEALGLVAPKDS